MKVWTYHMAPTATVNNIVEKISWANRDDLPVAYYRQWYAYKRRYNKAYKWKDR
jgi:hypothetical protein